MDTLILVVGKAVGLAARADAWLAVLVVLAALAAWRGRRGARAWAAAAAAAVLATGLLPVGDLALGALEMPPARAAPARVDGIVVLGGGEDVGAALRWGAPALNHGGDRLVAAATLARAHPGARVVFSGGSGALRDLGGPPRSEADVAGAVLRGLGLDPARLVLEGASRSTAENARLARAAAAPAPGETWLLVTSAAHMPRALRSFRAAGWEGIAPWPVDHRSQPLARGLGWDLAGNLDELNAALKEVVGGLAYRVLGR